MNAKPDRLLHYVLIILLMLAPVRSVLASTSSHCEMADEANSVTLSTAMHEHQMQADQMSARADMKGKVSTHDKCCCCDTDSCASNCDMGMSVSILLQSSSYTPLFIDTKILLVSSQHVLVRALTPPSRPPANLS